MLRIDNISVTSLAATVLRERFSKFKPRSRGDVFALTYLSRFIEADGTTVKGFKPGYMADSISPAGLGDVWAHARPVDAPDFLFMPKFVWHPEAHYVVDMASEVFALFSIGLAESVGRRSQ